MEVVTKLPSAEQRDSELKMLLKALGAFRRGEAGVTLPTEWDGVYGKIASEFNELTAQTAHTAQKLQGLESASRVGGRAHRRLPDDKLTGFWQSNVAAVNSLVDELEFHANIHRDVLGALTELKKGVHTARLPPRMANTLSF